MTQLNLCTKDTLWGLFRFDAVEPPYKGHFVGTTYLMQLNLRTKDTLWGHYIFDAVEPPYKGHFVGTLYKFTYLLLSRVSFDYFEIQMEFYLRKTA